MSEPLLKVENLQQHFKISRNFTVKAVNRISFLHLDAPKIELPRELQARLTRARKAANIE